MIASNASKELEALAAHMPHTPDADARKLALATAHVYYLELSEGVSLKDAQTKVGKRFFITQMHNLLAITAADRLF